MHSVLRRLTELIFIGFAFEAQQQSWLKLDGSYDLNLILTDGSGLNMIYAKAT